MGKNTKDLEWACTPEQLFVINPEAQNKISYDAINCALERARAITVALILDEKNDCTMSQDDTKNLVWAIQGYLDEIKILMNLKIQ